MSTSREFPCVALGGTFDTIHKGHEALLNRAFQIGDRVIIGVTRDQLLPRLLKRHEVHPYKVRVEGLRKYLRSRGWLDRAEISPLVDRYGPTVLGRDVQAIVVTADTRETAMEINRLRSEHGLALLHVEVVDLVVAEDGLPISTTRIRRGEIDAAGRRLRT